MYEIPREPKPRKGERDSWKSILLCLIKQWRGLFKPNRGLCILPEREKPFRVAAAAKLVRFGSREEKCKFARKWFTHRGCRRHSNRNRKCKCIHVEPTAVGADAHIRAQSSLARGEGNLIYFEWKLTAGRK